MTKKNFFTTHQRKIQKLNKGINVANALLKHRVYENLRPEYIKLIKSSNFLIISTNTKKYPDTSIKCGLKGFIKVKNKNLIEWKDYDGNRMFRTTGNISGNKFVSLLFFDLDNPDKKDKSDTPVKLRILGEAKFEKTKKIISVKIKYAFSNCPRYLPNYKFVSYSKFLLKKVTPEWKKRLYIKDLL